MIYLWYIPENDVKIEAGQYSNDDIAEILRSSKYEPEKIQFIADMIEDGAGSNNDKLEG